MTSPRREAYWVTSAGTEPVRCDPGLKGLGEAMSTAQFASRGGSPARVCVTWTDGSGQQLFEYAGGRRTWSAGTALIAPPRAAADATTDAQVYDLTARLGQPRRRRERARWPGLDLTEPPCESSD